MAMETINYINCPKQHLLVEQLIPVNPGEQDANGAGIEAVGRILVKIADGDRD